MSSPDREAKRNGHRKREHSAEARSDDESLKEQSSEEEGHSPPTASATAPRIWALPTMGDDVWTVADETKPAELALEVCRETPVILTAKKSAASQTAVADAARQALSANLRELTHESAFVFVSRLILSLGWLLMAIAGLRLPGEVKFLDTLLLPLGVIFFVYTLARHGLAVLRAHNRRIDAENAIQNARLVRSTLLERLTQALALRKKLKPDERGKSPDDELLDANAYRKLIQDGSIERNELILLGHAINEQTRADERTSAADLARSLQVDLETLLFYRDLAHAAAEIELDIE